MLATVIHLACGCCLHAEHFEPIGCCSDSLWSEDHASARDETHCCSAPASTNADGGNRSAEPDGLLRHGGHADHECGGCTCAATPVEDEKSHFVLPQAAWVRVSPETMVPSGRSSQAASPGLRCPSPSEQRPPLFERLLV